MDTKSLPSNIRNFPGSGAEKPASSAQSNYRDYVKSLASTPIQNLHLVIDCHRYQALIRERKPLVNVLCQEINLWAAALGEREISALFVISPHRYLLPFEFTRVLHEIASKFQLTNDATKCYTVVSELREIQSEYLALIKGLGFNRYQVRINANNPEDIVELSKKVNLIRDYNIGDVGVELSHPDRLDEIREHIREIQVECQPDYICLGNAWNSEDVVFTNAHHDIDPWQETHFDTLELGPHALSQVSDIRVQNFCANEKFLAALGVNRLPIHTPEPGTVITN